MAICAVLALAGGAFGWAYNEFRLEDQIEKPEDAPRETTGAPFTNWRSKTVRFAKSPGETAICRGAPMVALQVKERRLLLDGTPLSKNEERALSETCVITGYSLKDEMNWRTGGSIYAKYRERK